jgi:hypothetical protein
LTVLGINVMMVGLYITRRKEMNRVRVIGGEAYALISAPEQADVYVDPFDVVAIIGPSKYRVNGEMHNTCNVYLDSGVSFTTALGLEEISQAIADAREIRNKSYMSGD